MATAVRGKQARQPCDWRRARPTERTEAGSCFGGATGMQDPEAWRVHSRLPVRDSRHGPAPGLASLACPSLPARARAQYARQEMARARRRSSGSLVQVEIAVQQCRQERLVSSSVRPCLNQCFFDGVAALGFLSATRAFCVRVTAPPPAWLWKVVASTTCSFLWARRTSSTRAP